jgi:xanthine dehydrogenase accessory factor
MATVKTVVDTVSHGTAVQVQSDLTTDVMLIVAHDQPQPSRSDTDFVHVYQPKLRLAVIGAVHISQALLPMAAQLGYECLLIDPRSAFTTDRFSDVAICNDWPDEALANWGITSRTAVVTLTHDPKLDDPALQTALASPAFYIAALGSKKNHAGRCNRLRAKGFAEADIARIHGPAGLAIGAKTPAEIAISVLAQMTASLRQAAA